MTKSFQSKTKNQQLNDSLHDLFFDIRNACTGAAVLACCSYANNRNITPNFNQLRLMVVRLLNPEDDAKKPAGLTTAYSRVAVFSNKNSETGLPALMPRVNKKNEHKISENGREVLKLLIEELRRLADELEESSS